MNADEKIFVRPYYSVVIIFRDIENYLFRYGTAFGAGGGGGGGGTLYFNSDAENLCESFSDN